MRYIGPFLRLNTLSKENIQNELFHLSKESIKHIVLYSGFGIKIPIKELKNKNYPMNDINTINSFSPLLCIYKKGDAKLSTLDNNLLWSEDKFKKDILINSNSFMTLCLLELADYYNYLEKTYPKKYYLHTFYTLLAKKQLEFYASHLRNFEGVFIDKIDVSDSLGSGLELEDKSSRFKFSNQAFLMAAYYKCSLLYNGKECTTYKNFSYDIFNMFKDYKENLYDLSINELAKICFAFNIFYNYTKDKEVESILLDIYDFIYDNQSISLDTDNNLLFQCYLALNSFLIYKNTNLLKYKEDILNHYDKLKSFYSHNDGLFFKEADKKEQTYSSEEILLYLINLVIGSELKNDEDDLSIIVDIFKHQVIESGIINSWPDVPTLDSAERYKNFSLIPEDLLEEQHFKLPTIPTPEASEFAPVFFKNITYNVKKKTFAKSKSSFYSAHNMFIFFLSLYLFKPKYFLHSQEDNDNEDFQSDEILTKFDF